jgi:3-phytase
LLALATLGCVGGPHADATTDVTPPVVIEAWQSARIPDANLDSLAVWRTDLGALWLIATAKTTHQLVVFDAATGETLRHVGSEGAGLGSFRRPNGIALAGRLCLVVERDNRRVQVLELPDLVPVATFGESVLEHPYGIAVVESGRATWEVYVSDAYERADGSVPRASELGKRIKHFRLRRDGSSVIGELVRSFGATDGAGVLRVVESLEVDPHRSWILIAEEEEPDTFIKVYDLEGGFTGRTVGRRLFRHQVEGIALRPCDRSTGWWIVSDQGPHRTEFHLLDRETLEPRGMFVGGATANTDGIAVFAEPFAGFPDGALFAVDDDAAVAAFRWSDITRAVALGRCGA